MLVRNALKAIRAEVRLAKKDIIVLVDQLSISSHVLLERMELIKLVKEI